MTSTPTSDPNSSSRRRISDAELAAIENNIALTLMIVASCKRAMFHTHSPEVLYQISDILASAHALWTNLTDWKDARLKDQETGGGFEELADRSLPGVVEFSDRVDQQLSRFQASIEDLWKAVREGRQQVQDLTLPKWGDDAK